MIDKNAFGLLISYFTLPGGAWFPGKARLFSMGVASAAGFCFYSGR